MSALILTVDDLKGLFQPKCFSESLELRVWTSTSSKPEFLQLLAQPREKHGEVSRSGSPTGMSGQDLNPRWVLRRVEHGSVDVSFPPRPSGFTQSML